MNTGIENDVVRQQSFECDGPVDLDIEVDGGMVEIVLAEDQAEPLVHVEVRHARGHSPMGGLTGLLNLVGRFGSWDDLPAQAVRETAIGMHGNRIEVRTPKSMPLSAVQLHVVVGAPAGSAVSLRAGSADARIDGTAGLCNVQMGSGDMSLERTNGPVKVQTGSGAVHLGTIDGDLAAKTGSGDLEIASIAGNTKLVTGSGDVWIGTVRGEHLSAKTGNGDLTIADAESGDLELMTGSGNLRVGVGSGVTAELDMTTGSGRVRSDLEINDGPVPADAEAAVRLRCRTGSGNATVTRASA
jgi:Putative adhesin